MSFGRLIAHVPLKNADVFLMRISYRERKAIRLVVTERENGIETVRDVSKGARRQLMMVSSPP